jgi:hypothetical protein
MEAIQTVIVATERYLIERFLVRNIVLLFKIEQAEIILLETATIPDIV